MATNSVQKWDAILIDEGQDYYREWYGVLSDMLSARDELLLVCDKKQHIYSRELSWIDTPMSGVKFRGRWRELKTVFRLTLLIAECASRFAQQFDLDQEVNIERVVQLSLLERPREPHLVWQNLDSRIGTRNAIWSAYSLLHENAQVDGDIVILVGDHHAGLELVTMFKLRGIDVCHVFEDHHSGRKLHKRSFWSTDSRLKLCTIHSFKGWEIENVILLIPDTADESGKSMDSSVYISMTRTMESLIVLNGSDRYRDFGTTLPSRW
jgi:superfamily I DNA/RNA helicase